MYRPISGAGVHSGRRKKERPDQGVAKEAHHARSRREAWLSSSVSSSRGLVVLRSMRRLKKVRPAGTILAAKLRDPMRDSSSRLEQDNRSSHEFRADFNSFNLSRGSLASRRSVSRRIPKYSSWVAGPSSLSSARGTPRVLQRERRVSRWWAQVCDSGGPTMKQSSR